jgi:hypothetical protein
MASLDVDSLITRLTQVRTKAPAVPAAPIELS